LEAPGEASRHPQGVPPPAEHFFCKSLKTEDATVQRTAGSFGRWAQVCI